MTDPDYLDALYPDEYRVLGIRMAAYTLGLSVASTQAFLSGAASGMMALTGIVFAIGTVMMQFSAIAYSPRLAL